MDKGQGAQDQAASGQEAMGSELDNQFKALSNELKWVHLRWKQFRALFADDPSRVDLLNSVAPTFFRVLQDTLFEDTVLAIARILDPPVSPGDKRNLTIQNIPLLVTDTRLKEEIKGLVDIARKAGEFAVDWRNRRLAHRDLGLTLNSAAEPLKAASRERVEEALSSIRDVLNCAEKTLSNSETAYEWVQSVGDAEALFPILRDGIARRRDRRNRIARGQWTEDDLVPT